MLPLLAESEFRLTGYTFTGPLPDNLAELGERVPVPRAPLVELVS